MSESFDDPQYDPRDTRLVPSEEIQNQDQFKQMQWLFDEQIPEFSDGGYEPYLDLRRYVQPEPLDTTVWLKCGDRQYEWLKLRGFEWSQYGASSSDIVSAMPRAYHLRPHAVCSIPVVDFSLEMKDTEFEQWVGRVGHDDIYVAGPDYFDMMMWSPDVSYDLNHGTTARDRGDPVAYQEIIQGQTIVIETWTMPCS